MSLFGWKPTKNESEIYIPRSRLPFCSMQKEGKNLYETLTTYLQLHFPIIICICHTYMYLQILEIYLMNP